MNKFIETKEYKRFSEFCKACKKEKYIGLCYGHAGVGKSLSARHFAHWDDVLLDMKRYSDDYRSVLKESVYKNNTIIYTPCIRTSDRIMKGEINSLICQYNLLKERALYPYPEDAPCHIRRTCFVDTIIIDEADRLNPCSIEQIRDIYDRNNNLTIIIIGMPGIEKILIRFPQFYSRIGFLHVFNPLSQEEIAFILQKHCNTLDVEFDSNNFPSSEAIASIIRITQGNFRLINRLLKQAIRIMKINNLSFISSEVIESARECLVIGNTY